MTIGRRYEFDGECEGEKVRISYQIMLVEHRGVPTRYVDWTLPPPFERYNSTPPMQIDMAIASQCMAHYQEHSGDLPGPGDPKTREEHSLDPTIIPPEGPAPEAGGSGP